MPLVFYSSTCTTITKSIYETNHNIHCVKAQKAIKSHEGLTVTMTTAECEVLIETGWCMALLGYLLKERPVQCTHNTSCQTGPVCRSTRKHFSHVTISVTVQTLWIDKVGYNRLNYLNEHPSEIWQITPAETCTLVVNVKYCKNILMGC